MNAKALINTAKTQAADETGLLTMVKVISPGASDLDGWEFFKLGAPV